MPASTTSKRPSAGRRLVATPAATRRFRPAPVVGWVLACAALSILVGLWALPSAAQEGPGFVLVIHADNPAETLEKSLATKMFLKKVKRWPDSDLEVTPVDQDEKSAVREAFTQAVHGKRVSAIKTFWQRMIFSGRAVPPDELADDAAVLAFVAATPGAIGYVSDSAELGDGVKVLTLTD